MFNTIKLLVITASVIVLCSCGKKTPIAGPNPEDTVLVNTSEVRPDWIEQLDVSEQDLVIEDLEKEGLETRDTVLQDPGVWSDANAPKVTVRFDLDKWVVRPADHELIQSASKTLLENTDLRVLLTGYCDWRGTTDYNLALGEKRANSVKDFLVQLGVDGSRIDVLSRGDLDAIVDASSAQMAEERRVEITIIK